MISYRLNNGVVLSLNTNTIEQFGPIVFSWTKNFTADAKTIRQVTGDIETIPGKDEFIAKTRQINAIYLVGLMETLLFKERYQPEVIKGKDVLRAVKLEEALEKMQAAKNPSV